MTHSATQVSTPEGEMPAHLWLPEAGHGPGILLVQEIFGISRYVQPRAQDLAPQLLSLAAQVTCSSLHDPEASALAWQRTVDYLAERLPVS